MKIQSLKKLKNSMYEVYIDDKSYIVDEEVVLKYRLFKDYEISSSDFKECLAVSDYEQIKRKAYLYSLRFQRNSYETKEYLIKKEIDPRMALKAVEELCNEQLISDILLAKELASSLARSSHGPYLIAHKLKQKHFSDEVAEEAISSLAEDDIAYGIDRLKKKYIKRYEMLSEIERKHKMQDLLYRHGYKNE